MAPHDHQQQHLQQLHELMLADNMLDSARYAAGRDAEYAEDQVRLCLPRDSLRVTCDVWRDL